MTRPGLEPIPLAGDERSTLIGFLDFYREELVGRVCGHADLIREVVDGDVAS